MGLKFTLNLITCCFCSYKKKQINCKQRICLLAKLIGLHKFYFPLIKFLFTKVYSFNYLPILNLCTSKTTTHLRKSNPILLRNNTRSLNHQSKMQSRRSCMCLHFTPVKCPNTLIDKCNKNISWNSWAMYGQLPVRISSSKRAVLPGEICKTSTTQKAEKMSLISDSFWRFYQP